MWQIGWRAGGRIQRLEMPFSYIGHLDPDALRDQAIR
jgi:hypothetical protein